MWKLNPFKKKIIIEDPPEKELKGEVFFGESIVPTEVFDNVKDIDNFIKELNNSK